MAKLRAETSEFMYLAFVIMLGIIGVIFTLSMLNPVNSPEGRSKELATSVALYLDSLSNVEQGSVSMDMGSYKYDIEIQKKDSDFRTVARWVPLDIVSNYVLPKGYYVAVTPYVKKTKDGIETEEKGTTMYFAISAFDLGMDCSKLNLEKNCAKKLVVMQMVCINKDKTKDFAEVKKCD